MFTQRKSDKFVEMRRKGSEKVIGYVCKLCRIISLVIIVLSSSLCMQAEDPKHDPMTADGSTIKHSTMIPSLRQVLVPLIVTESANRNYPMSSNNRDSQAKQPSIMTVGKFGERKRADSNKIVWSQPDPRRSYSLPENLVKIIRKGGGGSKKKSTLSKANRMMVSQSNANTNMSRRDEPSNISLNENLNYPAANSNEQYNTDSSKSNLETKSMDRHNMITVIKYIPIVMSVPADQLIPVQSSTKTLIAASSRRPAHQIKLANPLSYYSAPITTTPQPASQQQQDLFSSSPTTDQHYGLPIQTRLVPYQFVQEAPYSANSEQPVTSSTSKALSAASRFISMLRPSTILSSMQPHAGSSQPNLNYLSSQQGQSMYQLPSQAQIYLIESAPSAATDVYRKQQQHYAAPSKSTRSNEMLAKQASQVQLSSRQLSNKQPTIWFHQQPNGLLCIHQQATGAENQKLPLSALSSMMSPILVSPAYTVASIASQQTTSGSSDQDQDYSSFDYVTSTTTKPIVSVRVATKNNKQLPMARNNASDKESPIKVARKLLKAKSEATVQQHQQDAIEDEQVNISGQQKLLGSPSENSSIFDVANHTINEEVWKLSPLAKLGARKADGESAMMIPFTIRDKIDLPFRQQQVLEEARARKHNHQGSRSMALAGTNSPVHFDDQGGEVELDQSLLGKQRQQQPPPQPPKWQHSPSAFAGEERKVKTSFISAKADKGKQRIVSNNAINKLQASIDYKKDIDGGGAGRPEDAEAGYTLPLLMASSAKISASRSANNDSSASMLLADADQSSSRAKAKPLAPFLRPSVVYHGGASTPSIATTTSSPAWAAPADNMELASSSVTTSSTLDGQPVRLASGYLSRRPSSLQRDNADESRQQLILVSSSSLTGESGPKVNSTTTTTTPSTVELLINSTPEHQATVTASSITSTTTAQTSRPGAVPSAAVTTGEDRAEADWSGQAAASHANHLSGDDASMKNNQLFPSGGAGDNEFDRISQSLHKNPLDLIDLQNSRSNFQLPAQLESMSMYSSAFGASTGAGEPWNGDNDNLSPLTGRPLLGNGHRVGF